MKTAVILAAGPGTKIWPYSSTRQKAALPLANKPLISWMVEKLQNVGVERIIVIVGYRQEQVRNALANVPGVEFFEQQGRGTAGAVFSALNHIKDDRFLLLYGDVVLTFAEIDRFIQEQKNANAICSALVHPLGQERPQDWICAHVNGDGIEHVLGHPRDSVTHRFAGLFALSTLMLPYLIQSSTAMSSVQVGMMPSDEPQLEESLQRAINNSETIHAVETTGMTFDLDKPWHYLEASYFWNAYVCGKIENDVVGSNVKISDGADITGNIIVGENVEIGKGVIIEGNLVVGADTKITQGAILEKNVVIGKGSTIRRYCQIDANTTIGPDCFIGHGAEVSGLFLQRAYAYHYGEFWGILGDNGDLGAATVCGNLRFDDQNTIHAINGRREFPSFGANAAYLGDYVRTGVNTILMPGVKIGAHSVIGAGTIVNEDVPDKTLLYVQQEQIKKEWGPDKYGW